MSDITELLAKLNGAVLQLRVKAATARSNAQISPHMDEWDATSRAYDDAANIIDAILKEALP